MWDECPLTTSPNASSSSGAFQTHVRKPPSMRRAVFVRVLRVCRTVANGQDGHSRDVLRDGIEGVGDGLADDVRVGNDGALRGEHAAQEGTADHVAGVAALRADRNGRRARYQVRLRWWRGDEG